MYVKSDELKEQYSKLTDEKLLKIAYYKNSDYVKEVVEVAIDELKKRGISPDLSKMKAIEEGKVNMSETRTVSGLTVLYVILFSILCMTLFITATSREQKWMVTTIMAIIISLTSKEKSIISITCVSGLLIATVAGFFLFGVGGALFGGIGGAWLGISFSKQQYNKSEMLTIPILLSAGIGFYFGVMVLERADLSMIEKILTMATLIYIPVFLSVFIEMTWKSLGRLFFLLISWFWFIIFYMLILHMQIYNSMRIQAKISIIVDQLIIGIAIPLFFIKKSGDVLMSRKQNVGRPNSFPKKKKLISRVISYFSSGKKKFFLIGFILIILSSVVWRWPVHITLPVRGKVLDAVTGKPIENAVVSCRWLKSLPSISGPTRSSLASEVSVTDKNGNYYIPMKITFHIISWFDEMSLTALHPLYESKSADLYRPPWRTAAVVIGKGIGDISNAGKIMPGLFVKNGVIRYDVKLLSVEDKWRSEMNGKKFKDPRIPGNYNYWELSRKVGIPKETLLSLWEELKIVSVKYPYYKRNPAYYKEVNNPKARWKKSFMEWEQEILKMIRKVEGGKS